MQCVYPITEYEGLSRLLVRHLIGVFDKSHGFDAVAEIFFFG